MTETTNVPEAGISSEVPASVVCTKCKINPRSRSNSTWCKQCHNEAAALYRLRARPRETFDERICEWKDCHDTFTWRSTHSKQTCCSKSHYMLKRYWDSRPPAEKLPENSKRCSTCGQIRLQLEFSPSQYKIRRGGQCRVCTAAYRKRWDAANLERRSASTRKSRAARLLRKYNAYTDDIDQIIADQGGVCKSCGGLPGLKGFHIDHHHVTNQFRGLLCSGCNVGIGALQDDPEVILAAARYVQAFLDSHVASAQKVEGPM